MKEKEREARIGREQDFYNNCAEILHIDHEYTVPFRKRDRWNARYLGNGRFPGFGLIRYHSQTHILVTSRKGTRLFASVEEVYRFLAE